MGREKLQNPAILGEILGENHALKIDPQEENKKRTACTQPPNRESSETRSILYGVKSHLF